MVYDFEGIFVSLLFLLLFFFVRRGGSRVSRGLVFRVFKKFKAKKKERKEQRVIIIIVAQREELERFRRRSLGERTHNNGVLIYTTTTRDAKIFHACAEKSRGKKY